ncbi:hypothetical protein PS906_04706 [Pseudomonas fluorescens]|nr:hypothetical protein PS906_04706 [Pseudomonas fluorescens]
MTDQVMPRYLPIDTYDAESPVLFINTHKELSDMAACAMHRFVVVRDLADTLSSLNLKGISDFDLTRVTSAVHLLMREGCAILDVIQARAAQREEAPKPRFSGWPLRWQASSHRGLWRTQVCRQSHNLWEPGLPAMASVRPAHHSLTLIYSLAQRMYSSGWV